MTLPSGVVTFVFSDIEGSTKLWESDPDGMRVSLAHYDEIVRSIVEAANGTVFKHTGDGFGAAFDSVTAGLETARIFSYWRDGQCRSPLCDGVVPGASSSP
jgi:class 3 adenylate cyclase